MSDDVIVTMRKWYQDQTTRWSWAPETSAHDLEIDLRLAVERIGADRAWPKFRAWVEDVRRGRAKSHIYGFIKILETERAQKEAPPPEGSLPEHQPDPAFVAWLREQA